MKSYLILMAGLPGTGKTTVGKKMADRLGYEYISQNDIRREYGMKKMPDEQPHVQRDADRRVAKSLSDGKGVVMDAAHRYGGRRHQLYGVASGLGKGVIVLETVCKEKIAKKRMANRPESDGLLVDARDPEVYDKVKRGWEPIADDLMDFSNHVTHLIYDTDGKTVKISVMGDDAEQFVDQLKKHLTSL